jgi:hypothetical protein
LLKHALPEVDVKEHFGSNEPKEITREINRLGQRELQVSPLCSSLLRCRDTSVASLLGAHWLGSVWALTDGERLGCAQAKFRAVYGTQTFSNNNNWLRRKLLEGSALAPSSAIFERAKTQRLSAALARMLSVRILVSPLPAVGMGTWAFPSTSMAQLEAAARVHW